MKPWEIASETMLKYKSHLQRLSGGGTKDKGK